MFPLFFDWYSSKSPAWCPKAVHFLCSNTVKKSTVLFSLWKCFSFNHCCDVISFRESDCTNFALLADVILTIVDAVTILTSETSVSPGWNFSSLGGVTLACWRCGPSLLMTSWPDCHYWRDYLKDMWHLGIVAEKGDDWPNVLVHCDVIIAEFQIELGFRLNFDFIFIIIIRFNTRQHFINKLF